MNRGRYDEAAGIRRSGGGLAGPVSYPSEPGGGLTDVYYLAGREVGVLLGVLVAIGDWLTPHPRPRGRVPVPDVRGLFYSVCLEAAGRLGLQVTAVRLTERPMPVDGLVVDQSPLPPATAHRGSGLTVRVWHPPVRPAGSRPA